MNDVPRHDDPSDDIDDLYRRAAALEESQPSEPVRNAIMAQAKHEAAQRTALSSNATRPNKRFPPRRRVAILGTLAAAVLAGLIVVPRFLMTHNEPLAADAALGRYVTPPALPAPAPAPTPAAPLPRASEIAPAGATSRDQAAAPAAYAAASPSSVVQANLTLHAAPDSPVSEAMLRRAAERGDVAKLQAMLELGVDVNARDADDRTALLLAVLSKRKEVVQLLLTHGANAEAADRRGTTPLQAAESTHQAAVAATLRAAGAHQ